MTTTEHLQLIKAKCEKMIKLAEIEPQSFMESAEAGWRATVTAIDNLELIHEQTDMGEYAALDALQEIIAAWPIELLTNKPQ
jgi:hypothetical protein